MLNHSKSFIKRGFWLVPLIWILIISKIKILFGSSYSADSYAFYFLAKHIFTEHAYYAPAIRDFYLDPSGPLLSRSYPPLFPLLIAITHFFINENIAGGAVINLFICMTALYLWFLISKRMAGYLFFIPFLMPILFSFVPPDYPLWLDAMAGRSTPLTLPLIFAVLYLLINSSLLTDNKISIGVGIFLGLLTLTRFDSMVFCLALPTILFLTTKTPIKKTLLMYVALLLVMLPWAIRNVLVFGTLYASSEAITAASNHSGIVPLQFYEHGIQMGVEYPKIWLNMRIVYFKANIGFLNSIFSSSNPWANMLIQSVVFLYLPGLIFSFITRKKNYALWMYFVVSLTWCVFNILCLSLTSYGSDTRYYVVSCFFMVGGSAFFIATVVRKILSTKFNTPSFPKIEKTNASLVVAELFFSFALVFLTIHRYSEAIFLNQQDHWWAWAQHIEQAPVKKGELVAAVQAEKVAYYTGWNTIYLPNNLPAYIDNPSYNTYYEENLPAWKNYRAWLNRWKPSYLLLPLYDFSNILAQYPHATATTIFESKTESMVLLKINLDEAALTKQDALNDANVRNLWKEKMQSKIPASEIFYTFTPDFVNGIARNWAGFFVPNTAENQMRFSAGRVVLLPNGEQRLIKTAYFVDYRLLVEVFGGLISTEFTALPDSFETTEGDPLVNPFFVTNDTWVRGVAIKWAGFYVENTAQNQEQYKVGYTVQLPTGEERTITKIVNGGSIITVYLTGDPIDGYKVGAPRHFKVKNK